MFEKDLKARLERIFGFKKTSFDDPGESLEQECLFISIEQPHCHISEGRQRARVQGECFVFANTDKLPYGYFAKRMNAADADDQTKFFFYETDKNVPVTNNIARRSFKFVFYFDAQYDPSMGTITIVDLEIESEE